MILGLALLYVNILLSLSENLDENLVHIHAPGFDNGQSLSSVVGVRELHL